MGKEEKYPVIGDYYEERRASRDACGAIAGICFLIAVVIVIVAGAIHSCAVHP